MEGRWEPDTHSPFTRLPFFFAEDKMDERLHDIFMLLHYYFLEEEIEPKDSGEKLPDDLVLPREFVKGENWSSFKN